MSLYNKMAKFSLHERQVRVVKFKVLNLNLDLNIFHHHYFKGK